MSILRADSIRDRAGTGAPDFPNGLTGALTGNVTGTASTATLANTATVATNAQGLTGTPNITVGTVTGTDATFSGNLTVQGTTTTIDTAVTSVDSLAVDGQITGLGNLGVGTANPIAPGSTALHIAESASSQPVRLHMTTAATGATASDGFTLSIDGSSSNVNVIQRESANIQFYTAGTERLGITSTGTAIFKAGLAEKFNNTGTTMSSGTHAIQSGNIIRFTGNESGANALNITGIHSTLANGEALSFTVICTPNGSGYISGFNIDGVAPATAIKWSGGSAPSASASGQDVYTFTVLKIGTATNAYEVYGAMTNYA